MAEQAIRSLDDIREKITAIARAFGSTSRDPIVREMTGQVLTVAQEKLLEEQEWWEKAFAAVTDYQQAIRQAEAYERERRANT